MPKYFIAHIIVFYFRNHYPVTANLSDPLVGYERRLELSPLGRPFSL